MTTKNEKLREEVTQEAYSNIINNLKLSLVEEEEDYIYDMIDEAIKKALAELKAERIKEYEKGVCDGFCCKHDDCPYSEKCKTEIEGKVKNNLLDEIEKKIKQRKDAELKEYVSEWIKTCSDLSLYDFATIKHIEALRSSSKEGKA